VKRAIPQSGHLLAKPLAIHDERFLFWLGKEVYVYCGNVQRGDRSPAGSLKHDGLPPIAVDAGFKQGISG
jgi:hypothetical protein